MLEERRILTSTTDGSEEGGCRRLSFLQSMSRFIFCNNVSFLTTDISASTKTTISVRKLTRK
jgi:hypothetical protein